MATFQLTRARVGSLWTLDVGPAAIRVTGPDGDPRVEIPLDGAARRIVPPHALARPRTIWISLLDNRSVELVPERGAVAAIRRFLDASLASAGPEAIHSQTAQFRRNTLYGLIAIATGVGLVSWDRAHPDDHFMAQGGPTIYAGLILVGLLLAGQGIWNLARLARIARDHLPGPANSP